MRVKSIIYCDKCGKKILEHDNQLSDWEYRQVPYRLIDDMICNIGFCSMECLENHRKECPCPRAKIVPQDYWRQR